jgi:hypothetical protein
VSRPRRPAASTINEPFLAPLRAALGRVSNTSAAELAGLDRRNLDRFKAGGDLKLSSFVRLAEALGLGLVEARRGRRPQTAPGRPAPTPSRPVEALDPDQADDIGEQP